MQNLSIILTDVNLKLFVLKWLVIGNIEVTKFIVISAVYSDKIEEVITLHMQHGRSPLGRVLFRHQGPLPSPFCVAVAQFSTRIPFPFD